MKRTAVLFLAMMMVGARAQQGAPADVPRNHWAFEAVDTLFRAGLLKGYPDGSFKGTRPVSRYEMAGALDNLNRHFQGRFADLKIAYDPQAAGFPEIENRLRSLRLELASIKASHQEVDDLTKLMGSLHEQLGKIRGGLDEMRKSLPKE